MWCGDSFNYQLFSLDRNKIHCLRWSRGIVLFSKQNCTNIYFFFVCDPSKIYSLPTIHKNPILLEYHESGKFFLSFSIDAVCLWRGHGSESQFFSMDYQWKVMSPTCHVRWIKSSKADDLGDGTVSFLCFDADGCCHINYQRHLKDWCNHKVVLLQPDGLKVSCQQITTGDMVAAVAVKDGIYFHFLHLDFENIKGFSVRTRVSFKGTLKDFKWVGDDLFVLKEDSTEEVFVFDKENEKWNASGRIANDLFNPKYVVACSPNRVIDCYIDKRLLCRFVPSVTLSNEEHARRLERCILEGGNWFDIGMLPVTSETVALLCELQAKLTLNYRLHFFQVLENCKGFLYERLCSVSFAPMICGVRAKCVVNYIRTSVESSFTNPKRPFKVVGDIEEDVSLNDPFSQFELYTVEPSKISCSSFCDWVYDLGCLLLHDVALFREDKEILLAREPQLMNEYHSFESFCILSGLSNRKYFATLMLLLDRSEMGEFVELMLWCGMIQRQHMIQKEHNNLCKYYTLVSMEVLFGQVVKLFKLNTMEFPVSHSKLIESLKQLQISLSGALDEVLVSSINLGNVRTRLKLESQELDCMTLLQLQNKEGMCCNFCKRKTKKGSTKILGDTCIFCGIGNWKM